MATDSESETTKPSSKQPSKTSENLKLSPNKRPKTLTLHSPPPPPPPPPPSSSKGKSKIDDESTADSELESCGICLSEHGKAVRGWIDSCDHYFCFVCIMEWAKVESRCPMCKQRFTTIRRPPKEGVFFSERIVKIPVRDQVYHYCGNATMGPPDPYSEVHCSACHSTADESFLLLCDLCDSAAHTYCVGLGATVPEGDWFCQDCTLLRDEHAKTEMDSDCDGQTSVGNFHKMPSAEAHVSIFDIVRESSISELERPSITVSSNQNTLSFPTVLDRGISVRDNDRTLPIVGQSETQLNARTLGRCRNVHGRIRALRENWDAFRSGSLNFSCSLVDRRNVGAVPHGGSGQPHSPSCSSQQMTAQKGSYNISNIKGTHEIDKAWKMMDVAKLVERDRERTKSVHQASEHPSRKVNATKEAGSMRSKLLASNSKQLGNKDRGSIGLEKHYQKCSFVKDNDKYKHQMFEKEKPRRITMMGVPIMEDFLTTHSRGYCELPSYRKVQTSDQVELCQKNGGNLPRENFLGTMSNVLIENEGPHCLISPVRSVPVASNMSCVKQELRASSSYGNHEDKALMKNCVNINARRVDEAKDEIQSLVKLNLKLLTREKKLEVGAFKDIARCATHSILTSCGLERLKPGVRSFPSSVCCRHVDEVQELRRSTLMHSSCRECFFVFVKDVVNTIMIEKIDSAEMSRQGL